MWLLNTKSFQLEFFPGHIPDYVILSHRWMTPASEECTFDDIINTPFSNPRSLARTREGFPKVQAACNLARQDGYEWIWIDSCCINKSSSADLQEAINSMWKYYADSNICYVYLSDVPSSRNGWEERFKQSEWFTRGWTLQELIAPTSVEFYAADWKMICTKLEMYKEIAEVTRIDPQILLRTQDIDFFSTAQKLSWAAHREVTREEDEAYSLLGLFDISMPLLYGEGRQKAFVRLQELIYNSSADHSLFLFRRSLYPEDQPLLADSPTRFCERATCLPCAQLHGGCLPKTILYTNILASDRWFTQAHEQILTTVTPFRNEMSTTLSLLAYGDVRNKLVFLDNNQVPEKITHVAVLNQTLDKNMEGALCLLLCQGRSEEVFRRIKSFPALLPNVGELSAKLQKTKILICPKPSTIVGASSGARAVVSFLPVNDLFNVQGWTCEGSMELIRNWTLPKLGRSETAFSIPTRGVYTLNSRPEVSCRIRDSRDPHFTILLRLIRIDEAWSIKEVSQPTKHGRIPRRVTSRLRRPRSAGNRILFVSSILTDRCSCRLPSGKTLLVGLRRLPAVSRHPPNAFVAQHRYQIVLQYL